MGGVKTDGKPVRTDVTSSRRRSSMANEAEQKVSGVPEVTKPAENELSEKDLAAASGGAATPIDPSVQEAVVPPKSTSTVKEVNSLSWGASNVNGIGGAEG
jgi:hypothetical protein